MANHKDAYGSKGTKWDVHYSPIKDVVGEVQRLGPTEYIGHDASVTAISI